MGVKRGSRQTISDTWGQGGWSKKQHKVMHLTAEMQHLLTACGPCKERCKRLGWESSCMHPLEKQSMVRLVASFHDMHIRQFVQCFYATTAARWNRVP